MITLICILWVISAVIIFFNDETKEECETVHGRLLYSICALPMFVLSVITPILIGGIILSIIGWMILNFP